MSQVQTSTFSVTLGDRAAYRAASNDVYSGRDTEAGRALLAEAQSELLAGKSSKEVQKHIQSKGAGAGWAPRVVATASQENWKAIMRRASADLEAGLTDSPDLTKGLQQVNAMLSEDPRMAEAKSRLARLDASDRLIEFLCTSERSLASQKSASSFTLNAGIAGVAITVGLFALFFATNDAGWAKFALLLAFVSCGLIGKGLAGSKRE